MPVRSLLAELPARWSPDTARDVLQALDDSRLPIAEFARREGIDPQRLYLWRRKLAGSSASPASPGLVELRVRATSAVPSGAVEVICPTGHVVRVRDMTQPEVLTLVLRAIERASC